MIKKRELISQNVSFFSLQRLFLFLFIFPQVAESGVPEKMGVAPFSASFSIFPILQDWIAKVLSKASGNLILAHD